MTTNIVGLDDFEEFPGRAGTWIRKFDDDLVVEIDVWRRQNGQLVASLADLDDAGFDVDELEGCEDDSEKIPVEQLRQDDRALVWHQID